LFFAAATVVETFRHVGPCRSSKWLWKRPTSSAMRPLLKLYCTNRKPPYRRNSLPVPNARRTEVQMEVTQGSALLEGSDAIYVGTTTLWNLHTTSKASRPSCLFIQSLPPLNTRRCSIGGIANAESVADVANRKHTTTYTKCLSDPMPYRRRGVQRVTPRIEPIARRFQSIAKSPAPTT
jgi:hypothetical protein